VNVSPALLRPRRDPASLGAFFRFSALSAASEQVGVTGVFRRRCRSRLLVSVVSEISIGVAGHQKPRNQPPKARFKKRRRVRSLVGDVFGQYRALSPLSHLSDPYEPKFKNVARATIEGGRMKEEGGSALISGLSSFLLHPSSFQCGTCHNFPRPLLEAPSHREPRPSRQHRQRTFKKFNFKFGHALKRPTEVVNAETIGYTLA